MYPHGYVYGISPFDPVISMPGTASRQRVFSELNWGDWGSLILADSSLANIK